MSTAAGPKLYHVQLRDHRNCLVIYGKVDPERISIGSTDMTLGTRRLSPMQKWYPAGIVLGVQSPTKEHSSG